MDLARILRAAETLINIGQVVRRPRAPETDIAPHAEEAPQDLAAGTRLFGQLEARLAGVLVSALKEAFDRDRAHLEMEREQIEQERRRAEQLMRAEMLRQAGERELASIRATIGVALAVWITSVVFMMVQRGAGGIAGLVLLAIGWGVLLAALGASFAAYRHVTGLMLQASRETSDAAALSRHPLAPVIPWLVVVGLGCTAASLIIKLA